MAEISVQASFNAGEWAPALYARVDMQKYRSGAALLENFYVDYRGGASTRPGTKYILQARNSGAAVRVITFQASFNVGYALEFGDHYIRFFYQESPVLENGVALSGASQANPTVLQIPGNTYVAGDWLYLTNLGGMTQLNGRFFIVAAVSGAAVTLNDLFGNPVNSTAYGAYTGGGQAQRVYTIASPYAAGDLALVKFSQNVNQMILCHPNYPMQVLTLNSATNWTIGPVTIGSTANAPTTLSTNSTLGAGQVSYSYGVTSIDANGQESSMAKAPDLQHRLDIRTAPGSNSVGWYSVAGAVAYNIYEADVSYFGVVPSGVQYGFVGTTKGTQFIDSNITPDFSQTPPIHQNPFAGAGVAAVVLTANGNYGAVPTVTFTGGSPTFAASATAVLGVLSPVPITTAGATYAVGDTILFSNGVLQQVTSIGSGGAITGWTTINSGSVTSGSTPANPLSQVSTSGSGTGAQASPAWGVSGVQITNPGSGYNSQPVVTFSPGAVTATGNSYLTAGSNGYPSVCGFFQQRLVLAGPPAAPQTFYMSRPGSYYNFDVSDPSQADDSITGTLVSGVLNNIKAIVSSTSGMLILTDRASWLVNGGSSGSAVTPSAIVANAQSFVGCSDVPPIVANYDVLYVQSKGSAVRDLAFNIYFSVFTGEDISVLSSHLFYGYQIMEWAWAEQPFYIVWAVRNDGVMLTLTFLKEQQFIGWAHHITNGSFQSVCAVTEPTPSGNVDAIYTVVARNVGGQTLKFIERIAERSFPNGVVDAWCVDSALQYVGAAQASFSGAEHLAGLSVTGLADGQPITPFVMPASGQFTLPVAASKVTIGLAYYCKLQTLPLQLDGQEAVQGRLKKLPYAVVRVNQTLGLSIGSDFNHLVPMKDLFRGNVSSMLAGQSSQVVTDLVSGDARTYLDSTFTVPGQFAIEQGAPYPATVLGVFPGYVIGDDK